LAGRVEISEELLNGRDIRLDEKLGHLELIDLISEAAAQKPWFNETVATINDSVVRLGVVRGEFHWHQHDDSDEFFFVLEGQLQIDVADNETVTLQPQQAYTVPRGIRHRTRAPWRTAILMVQASSLTPARDH
jgi:mannose-6-phosphate isomerase-like protein (cupin superfamily)